MTTAPTKVSDLIPEEPRRLEGNCPRCGTPVVWVVLWHPERGAFPGGTPVCESCSDDGSETTRRRRYDHPQLEALHQAGVYVPKYSSMDFEAWDDTHDPHLELARQFVDAVCRRGELAPGLFLHGPTGNGKTSLAVACLRELVRRGIPAYRLWFVLSRTFLRDLGAAYSQGNASQLVARAKGVQMLVIDEFGKEPPTDHSAALLAEIIDQRRGGTVITSNHSLHEIAVRYVHVDGMEHLISRLGPREFQHLEFTGPDRRFREGQP